MVAPVELVGTAEIASMLGVTRQRVNAIVATHDDFPKPIAELAAGRIWDRADVEAWAARHGREIPRRREPDC